MKKKEKKSEELSTKKAELTVLKVSTNNVDDVRAVLQHMGDSLCNKYNETGDIRSAQSAIGAYAVAINAMKSTLIYNKIRTNPTKIEFFEIK